MGIDNGIKFNDSLYLQEEWDPIEFVKEIWSEEGGLKLAIQVLLTAHEIIETAKSDPTGTRSANVIEELKQNDSVTQDIRDQIVKEILQIS